jgi:hypothetical protein
MSRRAMHVFPDIDGGPGVTWYPRSGLVAYGGRLYFARDKGDAVVLEYALHKNSRVRVRDCGYFFSRKPCLIGIWCADSGVDAEGNFIFARGYRSNNLRSTVVFLRAQSLIREWAASHIARRKAKQLAFAMAWHERLGSECAVAALPVDLVHDILNKSALFCF